MVLITQDSQLVHGKPRVAVKSWSLVSAGPARRQASIEEPLEGPVLPGGLSNMAVLRLCSSVGLSGKADLSQLMRWMHSLCSALLCSAAWLGPTAS